MRFLSAWNNPWFVPCRCASCFFESPNQSVHEVFAVDLVFVCGCPWLVRQRKTVTADMLIDGVIALAIEQRLGSDVALTLQKKFEC